MGVGKPIIAKLGTKLNPQKWVQLEEIVQKWFSHQKQQLSFQNKFLKTILTWNARNPAILYSCRKVYKRDSQPSSRTVTSPLLNVSFAESCLFKRKWKTPMNHKGHLKEEKKELRRFSLFRGEMFGSLVMRRNLARDTGVLAGSVSRKKFPCMKFLN